jgi:transcriptional regulator with GAF, ATPase, and Fis domain
MILSKGSRLVLDLKGIGAGGEEKSLGLTLEEVERNHILEILNRTHWRIRGTGGAAEILAMKPTTLHSRMKKLGIERPTR